MYPGLVKSTGLVFAEKPSIGIEPTNLPDRSRFGNHGTYTDAPTDVKLPNGLWVRRFDGSSNVITLAASPSLDITKAITLMAWIKRDGAQESYAQVLGHENFGGYILRFDDASAFHFALMLAGAGYTPTPVIAITDVTWTHFAGTYLGTNGYLRPYKNGVAQTTSAQAIDTIASVPTQDITIGARSAVARRVTGEIALPRIYNYVLTPAQIRAIYTSEKHWFGL